MGNLVYHSLEPISKEEVEVELAFDDPDRKVNALLRASYHVDDWRWVQEKALQYLHHDDYWVRNASLLSLIHLARIHGVLDAETVRPILAKLQDDPEISGRVVETLEEINWFLNLGEDRAEN